MAKKWEVSPKKFPAEPPQVPISQVATHPQAFAFYHPLPIVDRPLSPKSNQFSVISCAGASIIEEREIRSVIPCWLVIDMKQTLGLKNPELEGK